MYHSTLGWRAIKKKKKAEPARRQGTIAGGEYLDPEASVVVVHCQEAAGAESARGDESVLSVCRRNKDWRRPE